MAGQFGCAEAVPGRAGGAKEGVDVAFALDPKSTFVVEPDLGWSRELDHRIAADNGTINKRGAVSERKRETLLIRREMQCDEPITETRDVWMRELSCS